MTALMVLPPPGLAAQIAELKRERKMRERVYPFWITSKKMRQHDADAQMAALDAAIATLEQVSLEKTP